MNTPTALRTTLDIPAPKRRPMTRDESEAFVRVALWDKQVESVPIEQLAATFGETAPFAVAVMLGRLSIFAPGMQVREPTLLFLVTICDTPGNVTMWAFYLVRRTRQLGRAVSVVDLAKDFPFGFPTSEAMRELWDEQKGEPGSRVDNRLDDPSEWAAPAAEAPAPKAALTDPVLTADRVHEIARHCLFKADEFPEDGSMPAGAIRVDAVNAAFGFHPERIAEKRADIAALLAELPEAFMSDKGGGFSFLNACVDRLDRPWGEHRDVEALLALGLATGLASFLMPRDMWDALPGGLPYFVVTPSAPTATTSEAA
ncbi:MAG: hypothetical protein DI527_00650 [Chelatococcus sp.]|nr:MAG: hypothetical protein DI527_00650 [Chelatococcus sp.]